MLDNDKLTVPADTPDVHYKSQYQNGVHTVAAFWTYNDELLKEWTFNEETNPAIEPVCGLDITESCPSHSVQPMNSPLKSSKSGPSRHTPGLVVRVTPPGIFQKTPTASTGSWWTVL